MKVTHVIPYMHPSAGGPPVVVDRVAARLVNHGCRARVVTTDALSRGGDTRWEETLGDRYDLRVVQGAWGGAYGFAPSLPSVLRDAVAGSDLVHIHTLWTFCGLAAARACRRAGTPYVVMPHGMLDPHSLSRKAWKKRLYGGLVEWPNLRAASAMIYTHEEERSLAEATCPGLPQGHIVPLAADDPPPDPRPQLAADFLRSFPQLRGRRLVLFLGRLHPKKGLDLLVPAFVKVAASCPAAHLVLVGAGELAFVESLRGRLAQGGIGSRATFTGSLTGRAKWGAMAAAELFVLPSYQENFALTVADAMRMGLPVVVSRRVNIWREVEGCGGGWACDLEPDRIAELIGRVLNDPEGSARMGRRGSEFARQQMTWDRTASILYGVYERVLHDATRGAGCVAGSR